MSNCQKSSNCEMKYANAIIKRNIINAIWGFLLVVSFTRLILVKVFPRKGSKPYTVVSKFRKYFILPSTFGGRHIASVKGVGTLPLRWQSIVVAVVFIFTVIFMFVRIKATEGPETTYYTKTLEVTRFIGDRCGILAVTQLPVLFLFGGRNNVLMFYTGWSFDTFNVFHKWQGRFVLMIASVHAWTYTRVYHALGPYKDMTAAEYWKEEVLEVRENYIGIVAIVILGVIIIGACYPLRHRWYEIFLVIHIASACTFIGLAWHHVKSHGWMQYFYAAIAVWAFDVFVRAVRVAAAGPWIKANVTAHGDAVYVAVKPALRWTAKPGQYAFIYVLRHNFWESHPFSIVETRDGHYIFVAKKHAGVTHKLHTSVTSKNDKTDSCRVWIEGPYGTSFPIERYETVLLVAGGIGITAILSYALEMKRKGTDQHVILYWMVREASSMKWVKEQLDEITESGLIEINIFITGEDSKEKTEEGESSTSLSELSDKEITGISAPRYTLKRNTRPDMEEVVAQTVQTAEGSVAVVSCGPAALADACRAAVTENVDKGKGRVDYFEDAFSWA